MKSSAVPATHPERDAVQQTRPPRGVLGQPPVVQCSYYRFPGPGRGHHEVAMPAVEAPLGLQRFEDLVLMREGPYL